MADPLSSLIRPNPGPQLPIFERFAPPPADNVVASEIAARSAPGDVVIDLHGRGGWIARSAIAALRRVYSCESTALTRLLAEVVLRPPDLRHFDAGLSQVATHPRGEVELKRGLEQMFTSRCPTCGRPVVVEEYIWDVGAKAPSRKVFRCSFCREQARAGESRTEPVDDQDIRLATEIEDKPAAWAILRSRFPILDPNQTLPDELLELYTPRSLVALEAIVTRLDNDLKAPSVDAGLKLGLVHGLLSASRLNGYPGRVAALRIRHGHVQQPTSRAWRERNPWFAFEEGCRVVREFIARVEIGAGTFQPRPGDDMEALIDGTANVVLRTGAASTRGNEPRFSSRRPVLPGRLDPRSRVRLVLTQPPLRWSVENASFAYFATSIVLGRHAAADLPLEWVFGPPPPNDRGREATALRRSLMAVRPVMARDARAIVTLDRGGASGLVAGVLGGVGAGFRLNSALLAEQGNQIAGVLEFDFGPTNGDEDVRPELADLPRADPDKPFALADVERAVSQVAVNVLQARGEPCGGERLLGEVLIGLDRLGHLRRLVATQTFSETEAASELPGSPDLNGNLAPTAEEPAPADGEPQAEVEPGEGEPADDDDDGVPDWALGSTSATDHVRLLMEIVMGELRRPDHPRLIEVEPGRWWLRNEKDLAQARPPLSDRLEWAAFGLLSTSQGIDESTFFERVAKMFGGHDTPDPELVRAVLESYRDPSSNVIALRPQDGLSDRHVEHGELVGLLVEYAHRMGLRCHVSAKERRRSYRGATVGDLLSDDEQRAYVPLVAPGDVHTLEQIDCIWYLRGKATFMFEVEWTAMLTDALLRRGPRIPADETVVRFLVIPPERAELVRFKLSRSPLLRRALDEQNWHILKSDHLRRLAAREEVGLDQMAPMLGLDPEIEGEAEQLALFG
ncbi:MAG TPA: hypothetical protein VEX62_04105 [Candidatus Limnocylindrales bacterium]|nr:hypothetical protein [Candidatus Limnocylindrales bacterium]